MCVDPGGMCGYRTPGAPGEILDNPVESLSDERYMRVSGSVRGRLLARASCSRCQYIMSRESGVGGHTGCPEVVYSYFGNTDTNITSSSRKEVIGFFVPWRSSSRIQVCALDIRDLYLGGMRLLIRRATRRSMGSGCAIVTMEKFRW